jgi:DNA mismatch repair protein MutS2
MTQTVEAGRIWGRGTEWDAVRALLASEAATEMGRERARTAEPLSVASEVDTALEITAQARLALGAEGAPPLDGIPDIRATLDRCRPEGSVLDGAELALLIPALDAGPRLFAYGRALEAVAPLIARNAQRVPRLSDVRDGLRRALDDDGALTDRASARLGQVRREIREGRRRVVADLERLIQSEGERVFAERFVTLRHGRYVVPVRAEARGRVRGIVHDRSQSGQTLFVEPEATVEANNDLVQLVREEEQESARILAELTASVRLHADDIATLMEAVGDLDWAFARAALAERMQATRPVVEAEGDVLVRAARHPLLLAQSWRDPSRPVMPVDIELTRARPLLIVTGPNAGGKTIALKTLALLCLLTQTGCHVPAAEGARLPLFARIYAIIGDDQSVAENLSTFSAFVKQIREVVAGADRHALVLLDELGAGTDPDEGAALAQAILEELDARGALVVATTHLEPLRAFASTHARARNASVEFDTATLAPTFRLVYDRPGQSYALAIAARLGLGQSLIMRAQSHRSQHAARLGELLAQMDERSRTDADKTREIERRESETAARLAAARELESEASTRARATVERAKSEATALLTEIRRAVSAEWEHLKRSERSRPALDESRRRLSEVSARLAPAIIPEPNHETLEPGMPVSAAHLGLHGEIVAIAGGTATVSTGSVTVRVPVTALRRAERAAALRGRPESVTWGASKGPPSPPTRDNGGTEDGGRRAPSELLLLGRTTDEARDLLEKYLDDAFLGGLVNVRLIHGKGTGALRKAVRALLAEHPLVESFRDGEPSEGGAGATVAALKVS